jgi:hypothetical protein
MSDDFDDVPGLRTDPGALRLARLLAKSDFSAESRVRSRLRARLLAPEPRARAAAWAAALAFAALALIFPFRGALKRPEGFPRGENGLPLLPGYLSAREPAEPESLIELLPVDRIMETAPGRVVSDKDGTAIIWELDGATYALEIRRIGSQKNETGGI